MPASYPYPPNSPVSLHFPFQWSSPPSPVGTGPDDFHPRWDEYMPIPSPTSPIEPGAFISAQLPMPPAIDSADSPTVPMDLNYGRFVPEKPIGDARERDSVNSQPSSNGPPCTPTPKKGRRRRNAGADKESAPKRPKNKFFCFMREVIPKLKRDHPNVPPQELTRHASQLWRSMSESDKEQYEVLFKADQARYQSEMDAYRKNGGACEGASIPATSLWGLDHTDNRPVDRAIEDRNGTSGVIPQRKNSTSPPMYTPEFDPSCAFSPSWTASSEPVQRPPSATYTREPAPTAWTASSEPVQRPPSATYTREPAPTATPSNDVNSVAAGSGIHDVDSVAAGSCGPCAALSNPLASPSIYFIGTGAEPHLGLVFSRPQSS